MRDISSLGAGRVGRLKAGLVCMTMPLRMRIPALSKRMVRLRLAIGGAPVTVWLSDGAELEVIWSIFVLGEYAALDVARARTIVDLGANIGISALWFRSLNAHARIVSVEPDEMTFTKLRLNVGDDPLITCVNAAITPEAGPVAFIRAKESWGSRVAEEPSGETASVRGITLDGLVAAEGIEAIDILKVDIEGMEFSVLPGASSLARTGQLIVELHPDLTDRDVSGFVEELASASGLTRVAGIPDHLSLLRRERT